MNDLLKKTDAEILAIAKQLRVGYEMKRVLRYKTKREQVHTESNAEHVFALIYLANYFFQVEPSLSSLNKERVYDLLLYHDFGEIKHGDVHTYDKTPEDEAKEKEAAKEIFASLPAPINATGFECWHEYEEQKTPEAKFAFALDKLEPLFELFDPINELTLKHLKTTFERHVVHKSKAVKDYPVMRRFNDVISKDMLDRGVFWSA